MPDSTQPKPFCFVLMPFAESFTDIYNLGIKDTCEAAGAYSERVDEQVYQGNILDRVYNQIAKADFIIADMTGRNANVFYEVGYAHAIGKSTILLTQNNDDIPFDLKHFPHVVYNNITVLKKELQKWVEWNIQNPKVKIENKLSIEVFYKDKNLSAETVHITEGLFDDGELKSYGIQFSLHNNSTEIFREQDFKISFICSGNLLQAFFIDSINAIPEIRSSSNFGYEGHGIIVLPNSGKSVNFFPAGTFYPYDYASCMLYIIFLRPAEEEKITIRLYTPYGTRDYSCMLDFPKAT
jgi:hypothetical protein